MGQEELVRGTVGGVKLQVEEMEVLIVLAISVL